MIQSKTKTQDEITTLANDWKTFVADYGIFPELPYNETSKEIEFNYVKSYDFNKETIMNRILEWAALSFGSLDAVLHYKNYETGKIILKGSFSIVHREDYKNIWGTQKEDYDTKDCFQTYAFTIKNNKLKIEISNISYNYITSSYTIGNNYYPSKELKFDINSLYPITYYDKIKWKENLNILEQTGKQIMYLTEDLDRYIKNYTVDYSF